MSAKESQLLDRTESFGFTIEQNSAEKKVKSIQKNGTKIMKYYIWQLFNFTNGVITS